MAEKLTKQQEKAVYDRGGNLLVSAAAGSGKTKVLTDRLLSYIMDRDDPANIDDFLIITFTNAAAAELRVKIAEKLSEAIAKNPDNQHLQRQMQRLHMAQVSTVHAFCGNILREYSHNLDISADFRLLDQTESPELQKRVMDQLMEDAYQSIGENPAFHKLVNTQGIGRKDKDIPDVILRLYETSRCHLNPDAWLQECADMVCADTSTDVLQTKWGQYLLKDLHETLELCIATFRNCRDRAAVSDGMPRVPGLFDDSIRILNDIKAAATWDEIRGMSKPKFGSLTFDKKKCTDIVLRDQMKLIWDETKDIIRKSLKPFDADNAQTLKDLKDCALATNALIELVREYSKRYAKLKQSLRLMDFNDLEHMTLDLLTGKSRVGPNATAREIGARFREVMVDEYQDSNQVQDLIYSSLTSERNNCFMVGDVKQSIYRFRQAEPKIFLEKYSTFAKAEDAKPGEDRKVLLSDNFRSSGDVLECVNAVFELNMSDRVGNLHYGEDERLREGVPKPCIESPNVELLVVDGQGLAKDYYTQEAEIVAKRIIELTDGTHEIRTKTCIRPIELKDIAILLRSRTALPYIKDVFQRAGIPYVLGDDENIFSFREISFLISLLKTINNPTQDIPLVSVLLSNVFQFTADDLARLRTLDPYASIYQLLQKDDSQKSKDFLAVLEELRADARIYSVCQLLESIIHKTRLDSIYGAMKDGKERIMHIQQFLQKASAFENNGSKDLRQFIEHLDAALEYGSKDSKPVKAVSAVQITTIHKSKGLEYPVVFCVNLAKAFNDEDLTPKMLFDKELGVGMYTMDSSNHLRYPTAARNAIRRKMIVDAASEELRVLYVALTRARDRLIMTYTSNTLEKELSLISAQVALSEKELNASYTDCPGTWVLFAAMRRTEAGELFTIGGNPGCADVSERPWSIKVVEPIDSLPVYKAKKSEDGSDDDKKEKMLEELKTILSSKYDYEKVTKIPSKMTATQLKGRAKDTEASESTDKSSSIRYFRKPTFVSGGFVGKEYGNAYHGVMQYIEYEKCQTLEDLNRELDRLEKALLITKEQRGMINPVKIVNFVCSPIGQRLIKSDNVRREFKFSILTDAVIDGETLPEKILMQGVVDCLMIEPDGLTVVDFKSDRFAEADLPRKMEEHRAQVEAYCAAMERIFKMPVKEKILYFFSIDQAAVL